MRNMGILLVVFVSACVLPELSAGEVYQVGDSAGWTIIGNVDYNAWASNKTFQVGDTILFNYNPKFHNVMQVTHDEYKSCNATSPTATYTTGNDSITITTRGHHWFLCGTPGHCQAGQKVDINVRKAPAPVAPPPSVSPAPTPAPMAPAPAPSAASTFTSNGLLVKVVFPVVVFIATLACNIM